VGQPKKRGLVQSVIGRSDAMAAGLNRYFTGQPCKNGHVAERLVSNWTCLDCQLMNLSKARERDPQRFKEYSRQTGSRWRRKNPEAQAERYRANCEDDKRRSRIWAEQNRERTREIKAAWKARNPHADHEYRTRRYRARKCATPPWLSDSHRQEMAAIYHEARSRPGGPWHVDHIVPLLGKNVSGLHVPWNLQIVTAEQNLKKSNRMWPDSAA
jgi:hypothetical protein